MSLQLVLLGAPGSGKGTQAERIVKELGYKHVSTGDLLRSEIAKGTELGNKVAEVINAGNLVEDSLVLELLKANCDLATGNYIFDGFPRNGDQAKAMEEVILKDNPYLALFFDIDLELLMARLTSRRMCSKCNTIYNTQHNPPKAEGVCDKCGGEVIQRKDDTEETVKTRLDVYTETINPVLDYYESKGKLEKVDASKPMEEVFSEIEKVVKKYS